MTMREAILLYCFVADVIGMIYLWSIFKKILKKERTEMERIE